MSSVSPKNADPVERVLALRALDARIIVGLMSGTSGDGWWAAVVALRGWGPAPRAQLLSFTTISYPEGLRKRLFALDSAPAGELCELDFLLGEVLAAAALDAIAGAGLDATRVHLIASHGH